MALQYRGGVGVLLAEGNPQVAALTSVKVHGVLARSHVTDDGSITSVRKND